MKQRPFLAIVLAMSLIMGVITPLPEAGAASPSLSKSGLTMKVGESKVLKVNHTTRRVTWSIKSGKSYIKLKNKKKKSVKIVGKAAGKAVVKAVIKISSKKKTTLTCKVKVTGVSGWTCPVCGSYNTTEYCPRCGTRRPSADATPTAAPTATPYVAVSTYIPSASPSASPTATPTQTPVGSPGVTATPSMIPTITSVPISTAGVTPSPTPISPDQLSDRYFVMVINYVPITMRLYANTSAGEFYNRIISDGGGVFKDLNMEPSGENEYAIVLPASIAAYASSGKSVEPGELFMYGTNWLKLSSTAHQSSIEPTRIAVPASTVDYDNMKYALSTYVSGRITVSFRQI